MSANETENAIKCIITVSSNCVHQLTALATYIDRCDLRDEADLISRFARDVTDISMTVIENLQSTGLPEMKVN